MQIVEKYAQWSANYKEDRITVVYDTMWEGTAAIAHAIADEITRQSPDTVVKVYKIPTSDKTEVMTDVFRSKAIAVGSPTAVNGILSSVGGWLDYARELKFKGKKAAAFGCYGWSGESVKILQAKLSEIGFEVIPENVRANWKPGEADLAQVPALVEKLLG